MIHEIETEPFKKENVNNISEINIESTCTNAKKKKNKGMMKIESN